MTGGRTEILSGHYLRGFFPRYQERAQRREEKRENKLIRGLPNVYIRLFGNIDYRDQLSEISEKFKEKIVVLTTSDTPDGVVHLMQSENWSVIKSAHVNDEQARENSSLLLNEGLRFAREHGQPYAFFLASGHQRNLDVFYGMFNNARKKYPNQDAYYFILPETHANLSQHSHEQMNRSDNDKFLLGGFPYETALIMSTTMPQFETNLSVKGEMGTTKDGIPLGGMEFLLTLFDAYAKAKAVKQTFSPRMVGITFPVPVRSSRVLHDLVEVYRREDVIPDAFLNSFRQAPSLEVTPSDKKIARRIETWRAAMSRLGLTESDVRTIFSHTTFELGSTL